MIKSILLEARFSSAHFYFQPLWNESENKKHFGRCFTKYGHGHNYKAVAEWKNVPDTEVSKLKEQWLNIVSELDHEHLNYVIPEFQNTIPTTENICLFLTRRIEKAISYPLIRLELYEDPTIGAVFST